MNHNELLTQLAQPFPPQFVTFKPGHTTKDGSKCLAMAYADLRAYQERLDEVCGLDWSVEYRPWGDSRVIAHLTIAGVTRCSTGEMAPQDEKNGMGGTVAEAQAMKRAAAMFGLGRYLYELPATWVGYDSQAKRISKDGQNELDARYRDWYAKTMASLKSRQTPIEAQRAVDTVTGEITSPEPSVQATDEDGNPWNDDAPAPASAKGKTARQAQLNRIHALGMRLHKTKEAWDAERPRYVQWVTKGAVTSSKELQPGEADVLIAKMEKKLRTRAAAEIQSTGQRVAVTA